MSAPIFKKAEYSISVLVLVLFLILTSEVLPAIRKHGVFVMDDIVNNTDALIEALQAFKAERLQRMALEEETIGTINDKYCEMQRDEEPHAQIASQDDMDRF